MFADDAFQVLLTNQAEQFDAAALNEARVDLFGFVRRLLGR